MALETLYLVRHGEPEYSVQGVISGGLEDPPLSLRGKRQAADLAYYFSDKNISRVYSSVLVRAKETALILSQGGIPVEELDGLQEINMGSWEGLTFDEIRSKYPELYEQRGQDMAHIAPPGGENFLQALERFNKAAEYIAGEASGNIVLVAHAGVNRVFLCKALGMDYRRLYTIPQPYGCVNTLRREDSGFTVSRYGIMPADAPSEDECRRLLKDYHTPEKVIAHCEAVARRALAIAGTLPLSANLNLNLIRTGALLHDIARAEKDHGEAGSAFLVSRGYPLVAEIIKRHHNLPQEDLETITEKTIVFYADKITGGSEETTLEERFAKSRERCDTPEALAAHDLQFNQSLRVQALINRVVKQVQ